jgi:hypothetical protein
MRKAILLLTPLVFLAGCATATMLAPGAESVKITHDKNDVLGCALRGGVDTPGDYISEEDRDNRIKNAALVLGANVVLDTSRNTTGTQVINALFLPAAAAARQNEKLRATSGLAYGCDPVKHKEALDAKWQAGNAQMLNAGEEIVPNEEFTGQTLKPLPNYHVITVRQADGKLTQRYVRD